MSGIEINEDKFISDLYKMRCVFAASPNNDVVKNDYSEFISLNNMCGRLFLKKFETSNLFKDPVKTQKMVDKFQVRVFRDFVCFASDNQELMLHTFYNYSSMLRSIDFKNMPYYSVGRNYNEKVFKDIILSYYNSFGEKYYKIAKKYFDENRIQMRVNLNNTEIADNFAGFFSSFTYLASGYILSRYNIYSSYAAASLVHELGHAIDAETFIFPQQKTIPTLSDMLIEIPSTTFEVGFFDYLIKNKIDEDAGRVLFNDRCMMVDDTYGSLKTIYDLEDVDMDFHGTVLLNGEEYNFRDDIIYGLGYYFALCFSILMEEDKKEFLKALNNVMTMRKESTLEEIIELSNIGYDNFITSELVMPKIDEENQILRKRFNV